MPWSDRSDQPDDADDRSPGVGRDGHADPHDPRFELDRQDNIVLLALGERVDADFDLHRSSCVQCQADIAAYSETVGIARETSEHRDELEAVPPPSVWAGISAELGLAAAAAPQSRSSTEAPAWSSDDAPSDEGASAAHTPRHRRHRMRWRTTMLTVAAAVILAAAVGAGGFVLGRHSTGSSTRATAALAHIPGGPDGATGTATVRTSESGDQLIVSTHNLPLRQGYYQVWLYNPNAKDMIPVGTLAGNGSGTFPVPGGVDIRSYDVVDVSAQNFSGGNTTVHAQSVLQGPLTQ